MLDREMPLVTVVTVAYNSSAFIRDAIESVLAQSYTNIEYIIGDDCSTDNTWQIIEEYKDPRIRAYRNEQNIREYPNRNKTIDLATGKYLIFIDGDDYIYSYAIEFYLKMALANPESAIIVQKGYYNDIIFPILHLPQDTFYDYYFGKHLLSSGFSSNFFKTKILKESGPLSLNYISSDEEIRLRIALKHPVIFVFGNFTFARETPNQASSKLANGVGLAEYVSYSKKLLRNVKLESIGAREIDMALCKIERSLWKIILRNVFRLKFTLIKKIYRLSGANFLFLFNRTRRPYQSRWTHTPIKPLRDDRAIDPFKSKK
ncbi:MAG TPA: glycosyltransferase [Chitinophagaceae bacterium]|nr:glycosyltransferase [Chitinophagaceae bacterium]